MAKQLEDLYQSDCILKFKNQVKQIDSNEFVMEEYISNIENIYLNCFNLIFKLNEYINQIETNLKNEIKIKNIKLQSRK